MWCAKISLLSLLFAHFRSFSRRHGSLAGLFDLFTIHLVKLASKPLIMSFKPRLYIFILSALSVVAFARPNPLITNPRSLSSKRGLAYNSSHPALDIFTPYPKITWGHCWSAEDLGLPSQIEFVATLTDLTQDALPVWDAHVQSALSRGSSNPKYLMSFNEPDQPGNKAQMDFGTAAAAHKQYVDKYASPSVKIGSPSVTNGVVNGMGLTYLSNFLGACSGCTIDFVPVHWYGCNNNCPVDQDVQMFKDQMTQAIAAAQGRPVWIPEFGRLGSLEDQQAFLEQVLPWLDDAAQAQIERYAYFLVFDGYLTTGGALNQLGQIYVS